MLDLERRAAIDNCGKVLSDLEPTPFGLHPQQAGNTFFLH